MGVIDFLSKELALSQDVLTAIKSEELTDEVKQSILAYRTERELFYEKKYKGEPIDKDQLKKDTYTEIMYSLRNTAKKYLDAESIKDLGHKELFEKIVETKNAEIETVKGDDKTEALQKALKERDDFKTKFNSLSSEFETKVTEKEQEFKKGLESELKRIETKEIERIWERKVLDPNNKFDRDNQFYVDYLKMKLEQKGMALVLNEDKSDLVVKKVESGNYVDAYTTNGQLKIEKAEDLIKELSIELDIYPKSTGQSNTGVSTSVMPDGTKLDTTADLALAKALGF